MKDQRYVYSVSCTWHGSINDTKTTAAGDVQFAGADGKTRSFSATVGLPCCPHCGSILMEYPSVIEWKQAASRFCSTQNIELGLYLAWLDSFVAIVDGKQIPCLKVDASWDWRAALAAFKVAEGL